MPACQKCWRDAGWAEWSRGGSKADHYRRLIEERDGAGEPCTPEEQAGPDAEKCPGCGRNTIHEIIGECTAGCEPV